MTYAPPGSGPHEGGAQPPRGLWGTRRAELRGHLPHLPSGGRAGVLAVLVLAGALFATSASTADGTDLRSGGSDLRSQVVVAEREVADADSRLARLQEQVAALGEEVGDPAAQQVAADADALAAPAGLSPVAGAGLVVTLDDAPRAADAAAGLSPDTLIVHQQDLQAVVNALWTGGATAVGLQDQRIVSTSAVRCVGNVLRLQGRLYAPPYTVRAVGDPAQLRAAVDASPAVRAYLADAARVGLGWELAVQQVEVPGYDGALQLAHARVPR